MSAPTNLRVAGDRIEQLLEELRRSAEPKVADQAEELLRLVSELYGAGLQRVLEIAALEAPALVGALAGDELVASLLVVHGLHPDRLEDRLEQALARVRPLLGAHGGDVELLDVDPDAAAVRLRLLGSCDGCPSSSVTLRLAVERSILEAVPEIVTIDVDEPSKAVAGVPIALRAKPPQTAYDSCPVEMVRT